MKFAQKFLMLPKCIIMGDSQYLSEAAKAMEYTPVGSFMVASDIRRHQAGCRGRCHGTEAVLSFPFGFKLSITSTFCMWLSFLGNEISTIEVCASRQGFCVGADTDFSKIQFFSNHEMDV